MLLNILFIAVTILTLISISQIWKISEAISAVRGKKPYEITEKENNLNAFLCFLMIIFSYAIYFYYHFKLVAPGKLLPRAASEHGELIDVLQDVSFVIISLAYLIVQPLLWYFAYKYRFKKNNKALYFAHDNKLEIAWTIFPAIIFTGLIFYGLTIWNAAMSLSSDDEDKIIIELYARQFDWTARYTGADGVLGEANYTMISGNNSLGIVTKETIDDQLNAINEEIERIDREIARFPAKERLKDLEVARARSINQLKVVSDYKRKLESQSFNEAYDDVVINPGGEIRIPKGKRIELKMRSQDVIHSAYLPHFRVHMYCVPGMETSFSFVPTITSFEMQKKLGNKDFDFLLFCNNICGAAHWNMQMNIIVEEEEDFNRWMAEQKTFREVYLASN